MFLKHFFKSNFNRENYEEMIQLKRSLDKCAIELKEMKDNQIFIFKKRYENLNLYSISK